MSINTLPKLYGIASEAQIKGQGLTDFYMIKNVSFLKMCFFSSLVPLLFRHNVLAWRQKTRGWGEILQRLNNTILSSSKF